MNDAMIDSSNDKQIMSVRPTLESLPKKIYVNGQFVEDKNADGYTRGGQVEKLLFQLDMALADRTKEIEELWYARLAPKEFLDMITLVFEQANEAITSTVEHKTTGAPPTLSDARALLKVAHSFKKAVNATNDLSHEFLSWVDELMQDLEHYVLQIEMTYRVVNRGKDGHFRFPNRPANSDGKQAYWNMVQAHQLAHGQNTFPKPKIAREALAKIGIRVTSRTLRNWRSELEKGTLFYLSKEKSGNK